MKAHYTRIINFLLKTPCIFFLQKANHNFMNLPVEYDFRFMWSNKNNFFLYEEQQNIANASTFFAEKGSIKQE